SCDRDGRSRRRDHHAVPGSRSRSGDDGLVRAAGTRIPAPGRRPRAGRRRLRCVYVRAGPASARVLMLSLIAFLLLPLVALGVRRRRGVRALIVVMVIAGVVVDTDAQFHFLTALGTA